MDYPRNSCYTFFYSVLSGIITGGIFLVCIFLRLKCSKKYSAVVESYRETINDIRVNEGDRSEGLLALLQIARNNQELYMKNQWQIAYYYLLVNAGAIGLTKLLKEIGNAPEIAPALICILIVLCFLSVGTLFSLQNSVDKCGLLAREVYENIPFMNVIISKVFHGEEQNNVCCLLVAVCFTGAVVSIVAIKMIAPL